MTNASEKSASALIFEGQGLHVGLLVLLLIPVYLLSQEPRMLAGSLGGISSSTWFWVVIATAVVHQMYVWMAWRLQLHEGLITRAFPKRGFLIYKLIFGILGLSRFLIIPLAISNRGTVHMPLVVQVAGVFVCVLLSGYLFYSVFRYFGIDRAVGLDHFKPEVARGWSFVEEGIFRYTSNGMYTFGFLALWIPGLIWASAAALLAAGFHHAYIWVHFFCTEKPDMRRMYGEI